MLTLVLQLLLLMTFYHILETFNRQASFHNSLMRMGREMEFVNFVQSMFSFIGLGATALRILSLFMFFRFHRMLGGKNVNA